MFYIYKLTLRFFSLDVAIIASSLFTFSTMNLFYALDCRAYSLFLLLTAISFYLYFIFNENQTLLILIALIIINSCLVYTHYFGFIPLALQGFISILNFKNNKAYFYYYVLSCICILLFYLPHIIILIKHFNTSANNGTWLKFPQGAESIYNMIWRFSNQPVPAIACIILLLVGLCKFILNKAKIKYALTTYIIIWFLFPFIGMFLISYKIPMFLDRYLIFITPAYYILIAITLNFLFVNKKVFYVASCFLMIGFVLTLKPFPSVKQNVKEVTAYLIKANQKETILICCPKNYMTSFAYHYDKNLLNI